MRIVSLLPGATEIVHALGLGDDLVGVSHECDFPAAVKALPAVTRSLISSDASSAEIDRMVRERHDARRALYALDAEALAALEPDLIITQSLCDVCAVAEGEVHAAARTLPRPPDVVTLETRSLAELYAAIRLVAAKTHRAEAGAALTRSLELRAERVRARAAAAGSVTRMLFLEWLDPPFSCGHWNPELIEIAGACDPLGRRALPARTLTWDEVAAARPDLLFVSCRGFTMERTLVELPDVMRGTPALQELPAVRAGRIFVADGTQYCSRPGPRSSTASRSSRTRSMPRRIL